MFSQGQLTFGILFAIVLLSGILFYAYLKDSKLHQNYYKGSLWILLVSLALFLVLLQ